MVKIGLVLVFVVCLFSAAVSAQTDWPEEQPHDVPTSVNLFPAWSSQVDPLERIFTPPSKQTFSLNFGPQLFEVRASYLERRPEVAALDRSNSLKNPGLGIVGSYFNLLASASHFGGKLVGESEVAYSTLGVSSWADQKPLMSRLGIHGAWGKAGYGAFYRTFGLGFMPLVGTFVDQARDEKQLWGEYNFGLFRLRGALGEIWEENPASNQIKLTRTAATSVRLERPRWMALLSSSYAATGQGESASLNSQALTHGLSLAYRPASFFTLEPNLNFKNEWDLGTGSSSGTPSAGFTLAWSPYRDVQLTSRASYSRSLSEDPLKALSALEATTGVSWKIGKSFLGDQSLSFQLKYKNEFRANSTPDAPAHLTATVQLNVARF